VTPASGSDVADVVLAAADYPILEFDPARTAMIEPSVHLCSPVPLSGQADGGEAPVDMPERAVVCFFGDVVARVARERGARPVVDLVSEHGRHTVWEIAAEGGERVAFFQPGIGAPLAAFFLEEAVQYGVRKVVACGGAGALVPELVLGHPIVVAGAVRDEGTSYHYLPPARRVDTEPSVVAALEGVLRGADVPYSVGVTWTTDAPYRETAGKVAARRQEGCVTVEMEAAALLAVAKWRGVTLGQFLYAGDALHDEEWDHRDWTSAGEVRERLFWLAVEACLAL
jgi:uridine phosphorylase